MMKSFSSFILGLSENLKKPLPGEVAHRTMEASSAGYLGIVSDAAARRSAVLILLYPFRDEIYVPLILRTAYDGVHSGQVAFPGGRYEPMDEDLIHTALREAKEEIGVKPNVVKILGTLTEIYIAPSNFLVLPVVACIPYRPDFLPDTREVEAVLEVKLDHFLDPNNLGASEIEIPGDLVSTPHYDVQGHPVWGATAKMISELLMIVKGSAPEKHGV
ncbi:CoA pyrophosphatase [Dyadobacter sp. 50-39]|uniref:NUDIX hydrolase n=1 Tax=Dyadobacter sp. 50-39 TaxID=1895756 RepID=UPI000AA333B1|nr:CoA pyrophosphatase [Dyadobacter sp. 50-39]